MEQWSQGQIGEEDVSFVFFPLLPEKRRRNK